MTICMRYVSQTGQRATPTARITCVARHVYPTRPRFRVHSTVAPRECGIGQLPHYRTLEVRPGSDLVKPSLVKRPRMRPGSLLQAANLPSDWTIDITCTAVSSRTWMLFTSCCRCCLRTTKKYKYEASLDRNNHNIDLPLLIAYTIDSIA